jgi:hypothetical protein
VKTEFSAKIVQDSFPTHSASIIAYELVALQVPLVCPLVQLPLGVPYEANKTLLIFPEEQLAVKD